MKTTPVLNCIERELQLGTCIASPQRVSGGYLHKMYKIKTTAGTYALKLLNPVIMKRPDALGNYRRAEYFERILCEHHIPVVPALEINGKKMHCADGQYFYLFRWIEGRTLRWDEIRTGHCETIGALLSKIHQIEQIKKPYAGNPVCADWDSYIAAAKTQCPEIADELKSHRTLFYAGQEAFNAAIRLLPPITCISDGDMDCKNVLWRNHQPLLIDLECLDYGNPLLEMFQLALSWSGGVLCAMDYERLNAFITSYRRGCSCFSADWNLLYGAGYSWLDWLEYNIRRSLMIECENEEEQRLGISEVHETIRRIVYYHSIKDELLAHLSEIC